MKKAYEYDCYVTNEATNEVTPTKKSIVFSDSAYTIIKFQKLFGISLLDVNGGSKQDVMLGMKLAYVLVSPDVTDTTTFEDWLSGFPMESIIAISKCALEHLTAAFTLGKN